MAEPSVKNINAVTNHPRVKPFLGGGDHYVDMAQAIAHERVLTRDFGNGYVLFSNMDDGWEIHLAFAPEAWGYRAYRCTRDAITWAFSHKDIQKIKGRPPVENERVSRFAYLMGFTFCGTGRIGGDIPYDASIFTMTKDQWAALRLKRSM